MLEAGLAIDVESTPVSSLHDIPTSSYKLQVSKGSSVESYFRNSKNGTAQKRIVDANKLVVEDNMNERKTFRRMVEGNQDVNTLLMGVIQPLQYLPEWTCGGKSVKIDYRKINNGMIYQKNWAFRKLFDYHLLRMKEEGEIDRIKSNYFGKLKMVCPKEIMRPYSMLETMGANYFFVLGLATSFVTWLLEICIHHYHDISSKIPWTNIHN